MDVSLHIPSSARFYFKNESSVDEEYEEDEGDEGDLISKAAIVKNRLECGYYSLKFLPHHGFDLTKDNTEAISNGDDWALSFISRKFAVDITDHSGLCGGYFDDDSSEEEYVEYCNGSILHSMDAHFTILLTDLKEIECNCSCQKQKKWTKTQMLESDDKTMKLYKLMNNDLTYCIGYQITCSESFATSSLIHDVHSDGGWYAFYLTYYKHNSNNVEIGIKPKEPFTGFIIIGEPTRVKVPKNSLDDDEEFPDRTYYESNSILFGLVHNGDF